MVARNRLDSHIPRPDPKQAKRHMVSITPEDYKEISKLATDNGTTKGRIITALIANYNEK